MNKKYYVNAFNKKWDDCLKQARKDIEENNGTFDIVTEIATEIFEETANAEEVVGYYIVYHNESALKDWEVNTEGVNFTEQDKEIDRILRELY